MMYLLYRSDDKKASVHELQWTTTPPTEPGWYQALGGTREGEPEFVNVVAETWQTELLVSVTYADWYLDLDEFTHWLGPIPLAEPPKETE